jgi:hypothetical protein
MYDANQLKMTREKKKPLWKDVRQKRQIGRKYRRMQS